MEKNMYPEDGIIDQDMEKLLAILHRVPEAEIPERFEQRFGEALKIEGSRIREERLHRAATKKRKWYLKVTAAAAACFVVVFASLSMYNDGIGSFTGENASEDSVSGKMMLPADGSGAAPEEGYADAAGEASANIAEKEDRNQSADQPVIMIGAPESAESRAGSNDAGQISAQSEIYYGMQTTKQDSLCREGSKHIEATSEYLDYRKLVDEYLAGYEFEFTACERDSNTGNYLFEILILVNPEGETVNAPLILIGEQGEIHEQQEEQQAKDGEPIRIEGQPAENNTGGEEPQAGSD